MKAFGGVLNGLDGNFGPVFRGPKDERQDQPVLAFSIWRDGFESLLVAAGSQGHKTSHLADLKSIRLPLPSLFVQS